MKRVAFATLGCKLNQADTEAIRFAFERAGYESVPFSKDVAADVYVVNTCSVTGSTDHQCRQILRRAVAMKNANPGSVVVATGCYSQVNPGEIESMVSGIDIISGTLEKDRIPELVDEALKAGEGAPRRAVDDVFGQKKFRVMEIEGMAGRDRAFLRIQEGCDRRCSYCIVPIARGKERSAPMEAAVGMATRLAANGYEEIVLTGVHIGRYGRGSEENKTLADLLRALFDVSGIRRIRLGSIDPGEISPGFLAALKNGKDKICGHFHVSLQSGDDSILRMMRRSYTSDEYRRSVDLLREIFPEAAIGADVIVGFPGESDENHLRTKALLESTRPSHLHIFRYSPREGTPAAKLPGQVSDEIKKRRARDLSAIKKRLGEEFRLRHVGERAEILFESRRDPATGRLTGLTRNYIRVFADGADELKGRIAYGSLRSVFSDGMTADDIRIDC
ncbi:MAG: Threonylcarbamoyladenosine tRNA methylthiotransferase MtaB [bacterium ADurb.Bin236]|nr:MAG: Threonylcarbamoyladenosine tRNA methylthiotransferase MtaB [bacterium ADurb.Bin236]HOY64171.1 tRNA (N(6)-L-threonylcarbamoyladenosine(37)-C(2))-methylthiotransferase MtaB [bacterium]